MQQANLATFFTIREIHFKSICRNARTFAYEGHQVLIAPDPNAGKDGRYSVIHIQRETGKTRMLGRELPLPHARQLTSDFLRDLGENCDGSEAYIMGYAGDRKLYERGNP